MGNYVRNARRALGYETLAAWADHLNISARTLGDLERGKGAGTNTIAAVENALYWAPGSARDILSGGEPTLLEQPAQPEQSFDERLAETRAEVEKGLQQAHDALARIDAMLNERKRAG